MIKQRSLFVQQIKYGSDKICNALATTENDSTVGKKSTNILDRGGIQRIFQPWLATSEVTRKF